MDARRKTGLLSTDGENTSTDLHWAPHQTVSLQGFDQSAVRVLVQAEAFGDVIQEVQVFKGWLGFLALLFGSSPLVRGPLQVKLEVHAHRARQDVVHHHHPDVFAPALDAVEAEELGQQRAGILVQVLEPQIVADVT